MIQSASKLPELLFEVILNELQSHSAGLKEYDLIQKLRSHGFFVLSEDAPGTPQELFQTHFLLYHALYVLRDQLIASKQGYLEIQMLKIQLLPYMEGREALTTQNRLREYYLDLNNLENTSEEDVCNLIASFWNRLSRHEGRDDALAVLGLEDPVNNNTIKETYRRLAMQHHPDRGGDKDRLQAINAAINILLK